MRVVAIADSHMQHAGLAIPPCDVLVVAGDFLTYGSPVELADFCYWLEKQPATHRIVVAGNHDLVLQGNEQAARLIADMGKATYLEDRETTIDGVRFYGSPWTPEYCGWGFMLGRGPPLAEKWAKIPEGLDFLITHGPPYGILDRVADGRHVGCEELGARVTVVRPKHMIFGHIHEQGGRTIEVARGIQAHNVAVLDENYYPRTSPLFTMDYDPGRQV